MYLNTIVGPLSPPSSPRMSGNERKRTDSIWPHVSSQSSSFYGSTPSSTGAYGPPYTSRPYQIGVQDAVNSPPVNATSAQSFLPSGIKAEYTSQSENSANHAGGASNAVASSAADQRSPESQRQRSPSIGEQDDRGEEEDVDDDGDDDDDDESKQEDDKQMTAAEIRNQKRKLKRFRLTHNQTRLMLNEFARNSHPDAAHRARLSREIPGLSPRQVQVWFQNRRAKLKRLTSEDREKMMRSRAIPNTMGISSAPSQQYGDPGPSTAGSLGPGLGSLRGLQSEDGRGLTLDTFRIARPEYSYANPSGISPSIGAMTFTPPQSATDVRSPVSAAGEMGYGGGSRSHMGSPQRSAYVSGGMSTPSYAQQYQSGGRSSTFERFRNPSGEPISSPLRTALSYGSLGTETSGQHARAGLGQESTAGHRDMRGMPPPSAPYGLGFSYDTMAGMQSNMPSHAQSEDQSQAAQSSQGPFRNAGHITPSAGAFPPYLDYGHSPYTSPGLQQYPSFSPSTYMPSLSSNPYSQPPSTTQPVMPSTHAPQYGHTAGDDSSKNRGGPSGQGSHYGMQ